MFHILALFYAHVHAFYEYEQEEDKMLHAILLYSHLNFSNGEL